MERNGERRRRSEVGGRRSEIRADEIRADVLDGDGLVWAAETAALVCPAWAGTNQGKGTDREE